MPKNIGRPRNPDGVITREGYRRIAGIPEHRIVGRMKYPDDEQECHWCFRPIFWSDEARSKFALVIDHVDEDRLNNTPENLVASCPRCNIRRGKGLPVGEDE